MPSTHFRVVLSWSRTTSGKLATPLTKSMNFLLTFRQIAR
jgi:hypothetical protein